MTPAPIVGKVFETAARTPDRDALICGGERIGYGKLKARIISAALFLKSQGVCRGDRVVLSARNRGPAFVYGYLACHSLGAIAVPVDSDVAAASLADIERQTRPRLVCLETDVLDRDGAGAFEPEAVGLDEPADLLFTGGTTGLPKGVVQTHRNILAFADGRASAVGCSADDRLVLPLPLSHGYGLSRLRAALLCGGTVILVDGFLAPGDIFRAFDESGGTSLCCVPFGFAALFELSGDELGAYRGRLTYIETATAPLPEAHRTRLLTLLPDTRLFNAYGMTETTSSIAYVDLRLSPAKLASVGKPIPGAEIRIVDENGAGVPAGASGRILIRGDSVMQGYWEDSAKTSDALAGGWYEANDLGSVDADGYLYLKGRREELINVGGLKVAPAEIENVLKAHPAVADCACVAIADPAGFTGERVQAFLVAAAGPAAKPSERELGEWLRGRVEPYKIPARFVWVDSIPKTGLGKVKKTALKERG